MRNSLIKMILLDRVEELEKERDKAFKRGDMVCFQNDTERLMEVRRVSILLNIEL